MSRPESEPKGKVVIDSKKFAIANTVLVLSGFASAIIGGHRTQQEYSHDQQTIGAITQEIKTTDFAPPEPGDLEKAQVYVKDFVGGIDNNSDNHELFTVTQKILTQPHVDENNELEKHFGVLWQEEKYQAARSLLISEAGANDLEDANLWTLGVGASAAAVGLAGLSFIAGANIGSMIGKRKEKSHHVEVTHDA